jgi:hypothetical protein
MSAGKPFMCLKQPGLRIFVRYFGVTRLKYLSGELPAMNVCDIFTTYNLMSHAHDCIYRREYTG